MKNLRVLLIFILFYSLSISGQSIEDIKMEIQKLVKDKTGIDYLIYCKKATPADFKPSLFLDPNNLLEDCYLFLTRSAPMDDGTSKNSFIGIFKKGSIIWESPRIINAENCWNYWFSQVKDLNNNGDIEIVTIWSQSMSEYSQDIWIISWDGNSGEVANRFTNNGRSEINIVSGSLEIVDIEGDGTLEIIGKNLDKDQEKVYSWNANIIGDFGKNLPQIYPRDKIDPKINTKVTKLDSIYNYNFELENQNNSLQSIENFAIHCNIFNINASKIPPRWDFSIIENQEIIIWNYNILISSDFYNSLIHPGESQYFGLKSVYVPSIVDFYTQGNNGDICTDINEIFINSVRNYTIGPSKKILHINSITLLDTILGYVYHSFQLNWISKEFTSDKYTSLFTAAKTQLQQNNISAVKKTLKTVLTELDKDSTNSITSEAYALLRYNTEYLLEHLPEQANTISTYSLFASHSLWLELGSKVLSGDIGVNDAGSPPFLDSQVELSAGVSSTASGYSVKANRIKVKQNAKINGDIYYNQIENNGTITGTKNTPIDLPLFPPAGEAGSSLPEFKSSSPGTQNITVQTNKEQYLQPGNYGNIDVKMNGKIIFAGGDYNIKNLNAGFNAKLLFQSASDIRISDKFDSNEGSYIGPKDTAVLTAKEIKFYVAGINGTAGTLSASPKAAKIGIKNKVKANFYVPNGTLWIMMNSDAEGAFIAKDISIGVGTKIKLNSAF
jgi:hypothetical protein